MRVDKFLKNSRIIKRRTVAKQACEQGKVKINNKTCKPGDEVKVGDMLSIDFGNNEMNIEILELRDNVGKDDAKDLFKNLD